MPNRKYPDYKLAICGAHSQGKTTLVDKLVEESLLEDLHFSFRTNTTRDLAKILPINEAGGTISQYLIMARHLEFAVTPGRWIIDRGALDGIAYSHFFFDKGNIDKIVMDAIEKIYETCIPYYNQVLYIAPELPLIDDGTRSVDREFFDGVVKQFDFYIRHYSISDKIVFLTGSTEDRVKRVMEAIKKDFEV